MIKCDNSNIQISGRKGEITADFMCIISRLKKDVMTISDIKFSILAGLKPEEYRQSVLLPKVRVLSEKEFDKFVSEELNKELNNAD